MKRLLALLRSDTEIVLQPGEYLGEYIIRAVRRIDDTDTVNVAIRVNPDMLLRDRFPSEMQVSLS